MDGIDDIDGIEGIDGVCIRGVGGICDVCDVGICMGGICDVCGVGICVDGTCVEGLCVDFIGIEKAAAACLTDSALTLATVGFSSWRRCSQEECPLDLWCMRIFVSWWCCCRSAYG
jgi:hypothetical protein